MSFTATDLIRTYPVIILIQVDAGITEHFMKLVLLFKTVVRSGIIIIIFIVSYLNRTSVHIGTVLYKGAWAQCGHFKDQCKVSSQLG